MPPAKRLIQSPRDPEARFFPKRGKVWTGRKVRVTETCDGPLHLATSKFAPEQTFAKYQIRRIAPQFKMGEIFR